MEKQTAERTRLNDQINEHFKILRKCTVETDRYGRLLLASPPATRYPYIYPRDASSAVQLLRRIAAESETDYDTADEAFQLMESMARFIKDVASDAGCWGQRYELTGETKSVYKQEDNIAHGISILCNYLLSARRLGRTVTDQDEFLQRINWALRYSIEHIYHRELNLFRSTTAIHESALEEGYTCWVNYSFLYAFSLADEVAREVDIENRNPIIEPEFLAFRKHFLYVINELFTTGDRYVRRIQADGHIDLRPDFTLLSPFYFGFMKDSGELERTVRYLERLLTDPELGMIMRYLPFDSDFATHVHAGNGPWVQYTAILAQYHFWSGRQEKGDELLRKIDSYRSDDGGIPEHLSTCKRFEEFMEREWATGLDYAKEFHPPLLLNGLHFDRILEEANNMARSYQETGEKCFFPEKGEKEGGFIQFATPLMWSHIEYMRALLIRAGDWWKLGNSATKGLFQK